MFEHPLSTHCSSTQHCCAGADAGPSQAAPEATQPTRSASQPIPASGQLPFPGSPAASSTSGASFPASRQQMLFTPPHCPDGPLAAQQRSGATLTQLKLCLMHALAPIVVLTHHPSNHASIISVLGGSGLIMSQCYMVQSPEQHKFASAPESFRAAQLCLSWFSALQFYCNTPLDQPDMRLMPNILSPAQVHAVTCLIAAESLPIPVSPSLPPYAPVRHPPRHPTLPHARVRDPSSQPTIPHTHPSSLRRVSASGTNTLSHSYLHACVICM